MTENTPQTTEEMELEPLSKAEEKRLAELEAVIQKDLKGFIRVGIALREIRNNRLYRAKYSTWKEYLRGEWDLSKSYGEYQINAATVVENLQLNVHNCGHSETEKSHNCSTSEIEKGHNCSTSEIEKGHNCASFEKERGIKMSPIGDISLGKDVPIPIPKNEAQARPLTLLPTPEHQAKAWQKTLEQTEGKVTALAVSRVVDEMLEELKAQERQEIKESLASVSGDTLAVESEEPAKGHEPKVVEVPEEFTEQYNKLIDILDMYRRANWKGFNRKLAIEYLEAIKDFLK